MCKTIRSIFRQREVEKLYSIIPTKEEHWGFGRSYSVTMFIGCDNENVISDNEIARYDIEIPMLEVGDKFFLHDIQEAIVVKSRMRCSDGSIVYYADDKAVETENTQKSLDECNEIYKHWGYEKERFEELNAKLRECNDELVKCKAALDECKHKFLNMGYLKERISALAKR